MSLRELNRSNQIVVYGLLCLILFTGFVLRTWNINFDHGTLSHPDERSTVCSYAPRIGLPDSWAQFKDPHQSPLNPMWDVNAQERRGFTYGHFPLYLGVAMGNVLHTLAPVAERVGLPESTVLTMQRATDGCSGVSIPGRLTIALLDTLTILLLFLLGRRMVGAAAMRRMQGAVVGLLAAAFYAVAAQAVQLSHFFAMDPASATFTVLAVLGSVMMLQERSWRAALVAGVGAGLAISSKFSALPVLAAPVTAGILTVWGATPAVLAPVTADRARQQVAGALGVFVALLVAALSFAVTSPYAILDWQSFLQATLVEQGQMVRGVADFPFTRQYRNTVPYLYFIEQQVAWGLWWPLGTVAVLGTLYALVQLVRSLWRLLVSLFAHNPVPWLSEAQTANVVVWSWVLPYFAITGAFLAKFNRYMLPILPFVLLFGAVLVGRLWWLRDADAQSEERARDSARSSALLKGASRTLAVVIALAGILGGGFWTAAYVNGVYNVDHPWVIASRWMAENVPPGSVILCEQWDDCLPPGLLDEPAVIEAGRSFDQIFWGPYEDDTAAKYEILKEKLRAADYVVYASKRIYDSVDELPERYPMTIRYYDGMWDGSLGFERALDVSTPPQLFGMVFEDRGADESWSLYDHPQVTIFRKVRDLSDAEFDAVLGGSWQGARLGYVGEGSPIDPVLNVLGLGRSPSSAKSGLLNRVIGALMGEESAPAPEEQPDLMLETPLEQLPVVDNYRWNVFASERTWASIVWWWFVVSLLGWLAWPISFAVFGPLRDRGYLLSRALGWLLAGWLLWLVVSLGWAINSVVNSWLVVLLLGAIGAGAAYGQRTDLRAYVRRNWGLLLAGEVLFAAAFGAFVLIRMANPDLWQPWFGGEKFMEFAFLNGILRSPTFPPVDPHFAGGYINYYYFGIYLVTYLIKLTGIYAEVAFNLAIATLFALTVVNTFAVSYSAVRTTHARRRSLLVSGQDSGGNKVEDRLVPEDVGAHPGRDSGVVEPVPASGKMRRNPAVSITILDEEEDTTAELQPVNEPVIEPPVRWRYGLLRALLGPLFVVILGNLEGFAQIVRMLVGYSDLSFRSALPGVETLVHAVDGLVYVMGNDQPLVSYDFWGPSRVIPGTINEFPYWSFLFADLHPHLIGIPFAALFLALILVMVRVPSAQWSSMKVHGVLLWLALGLMLGTLASVNLWELPTYFGLGVLALLVTQFHYFGRVRWWLTGLLTVLYALLAYLAFQPFFSTYTSPAVGGVGLVREPDEPGTWLLIWGFFYFVLISWVFYAAAQRPHRPPLRAGTDVRPTGVERWLSLSLRKVARLPRLLALHRLLVRQPTVMYLLGISLPPLLAGLALVALMVGHVVLALCLLPLGVAFLLLWRRPTVVNAGSLFIALMVVTGLAILAGTQIIYLKDFLAGGDWYRMNTLFKFFSQVWVLWGLAAAIALPRFWSDVISGARGVRPEDESGEMGEAWLHEEALDRGTVSVVELTPTGETVADPPRHRGLRAVWVLAFLALLVPSFAFLIWGTPARLEQRLVGWRPEFGTLNGLDYMRDGVYTWPDTSNPIELEHDWAAIQWLLQNVRGNLVIAESSEVDYYRAGGTRVASMTGLSGLRGMHASEQRFGAQVGARDGLHRQLWSSTDPAQMFELIEQLDVSLIYVGQLERHLHPEAAGTLEALAAGGQLAPLYENERVTIYGVPQHLANVMESSSTDESTGESTDESAGESTGESVGRTE